MKTHLHRWHCSMSTPTLLLRPCHQPITLSRRVSLQKNCFEPIMSPPVLYQIIEDAAFVSSSRLWRLNNNFVLILFGICISSSIGLYENVGWWRHFRSPNIANNGSTLATVFSCSWNSSLSGADASHPMRIQNVVHSSVLRFIMHRNNREYNVT